MNKAPVLLFSAIRSEHAALARGLGSNHPIPARGVVQHIPFPQSSLWLLHSGMGPENTCEVLNSTLSAVPCSAVINIGYCGALAPGIPPSRIILYNECLLIDRENPTPPSFHPDPFLFSRIAGQFAQSGKDFSVGRGLTVPRIISKSEEKKDLGLQWAGCAVDMESAIVFSCAKTFGIPCASIRIVLDEQKQDLPDFSGWTTPEGKLLLKPSSLIKAISKYDPVLTRQWRELERNAGKTLEDLAAILKCLFT